MLSLFTAFALAMALALGVARSRLKASSQKQNKHTPTSLPKRLRSHEGRHFQLSHAERRVHLKVHTPTSFASALKLACAAGAGEQSGKSPPRGVIIAGAPASGKGTQCEGIVNRHGMVHISAGDLLRSEVAEGTERGKLAKQYMDQGELVPNEVVVDMVVSRLQQEDCRQRGWLLDGFPRSKEQAEALEARGFRPDVFLLLDVPDEELVERVVGRREDPKTGKIYHLKFDPPESKEVQERLLQRDDDTEEKVRNRLRVHHQNVESVIGNYSDVLVTIDGGRDMYDVASDIDDAINRSVSSGAGA